jgi:hypothetical protein
VPSNPAPTGQVTSYFDSFGVRNRFDGAQVGASWGVNYRGFLLDVSGKLGLGLMHADASVNGATVQQMADGTITRTAAGVLATATSSGSYSRDWFCVVPELGLTVGYDFTSWLRAVVGYDYLYVSRVARPAGFLGSSDSRQVPQLATFDPTVRGVRPALSGESLWAQGLHCGLEFRY